VRAATGPALRIVCPGVRMPDAPPDDQARTLTPAEALAAGADYLVVGRPIRDAADPVRAADEIASSLAV
jgi:orotidine-5'-phosphate decarboxylase